MQKPFRLDEIRGLELAAELRSSAYRQVDLEWRDRGDSRPI
jgi:hypothetical protein